MAKKTSKKKSHKSKSKPKGNPIYSRLSYEDAYYTRRNVLEMEAGLLGIMQNIESYKELRKRELMWKLKLKKDLKIINENISDIMKEVPKTEGLKKIHEEHQERKKKGLKSNVGMNIESELAEIQQKLEEMNM